MKTIVYKLTAIYIFIAMLAFCSCKNSSIGDCFESTGGNTTESRPVADFTTIYVYNNPDVVITQDTVNSIVVEAGDHLLSEITTDIANGQLTIENNNTCNWVRSYKRKVIIYIHAKTLQDIEHYGSGEITCTNTIVANTFVTNNWASGDVMLILNVQHALAKTNVAAGNVTYSGTTGDIYIWDICQGIIHCENLAAQTATVICKSTGDCYVNADNELSSQINGEASIYYYGNPVITQNINTGTGQLVHVQ